MGVTAIDGDSVAALGHIVYDCGIFIEGDSILIKVGDLEIGAQFDSP